MASYRLLIGDPSYSSWSLRGWLAFKAFGIPVKVETTRFYQPGFRSDLEAFADNPPVALKTVPVVAAEDGSYFTDSIALVEELHSRHPEAGLLPSDPSQRALARNLIAEMHSSFTSLRTQCPMNTRLAYTDMPVSDALQADLDRLESLWAVRKDKTSWLCGAYSAADAFYAPVAARLAGYGLPISATMQSYVDMHLAHLPFRQFRALGLTHAPQSYYDKPYSQTDWPGPAPRYATPTERTDSVNSLCPYSGQPVAHFLEMAGKIYGFCNAACRDKTCIDPEAWPAFMALTNAD